MKKLLLTAAATAVLSTSAIAAENMFYLRADAGANMFTKKTANDVKMKGKTFASFDVGVGYYLMDNMRFEAVLSKPFNGEVKGTKAGVTQKYKSDIIALMAKGYVDVFDFSAGKVFLGAGLGWAQVSEKVSWTGGNSDKLKKKNNLAWMVGAGAGFGVADGVNLDVQYNFTGYGKSKAKAPQIAIERNAHSVKFGVRFDI